MNDEAIKRQLANAIISRALDAVINDIYSKPSCPPVKGGLADLIKGDK